MIAVPSFRRSQAVASAVRSLRVFLATTLLDVREWLAGLRPSHSTIGPGHCSALPWDGCAQGGVPAVGPIVPELTGSVLGLFILAGLWTPAVGALVAVVQVWIALTGAGDESVAIILAALGGTLAMIGPGAWSIDARLFGRKHIAEVERNGRLSHSVLHKSRKIGHTMERRTFPRSGVVSALAKLHSDSRSLTHLPGRRMLRQEAPNKKFPKQHLASESHKG
jgi:hypothetical protein